MPPGEPNGQHSPAADEDSQGLLTIEQAAEILGYKPRSVRGLIQKGRLPTQPIGNGRVRGIDPKDLEQFRPVPAGRTPQITEEQWASIDRAIELGERPSVVAEREGINRVTIYRHQQAMKKQAAAQNGSADLVENS